MPGMSKAARRRQKTFTKRSRDELTRPFFGRDVLGVAHGVAQRGEPLLSFLLRCGPQDVNDYAARLGEATLRITRDSRDAPRDDEYMTLDAVIDGEVVGRLTTTMTGMLTPVVDKLEASNICELHLLLVSMHDDAESSLPPFRVPVEFHVDPWEQREPEVVEIGTGPHMCYSVNVHTGVSYAHRFPTREEARRQAARNRAEDRPFAGVEKFAS